MPTRSKSLAPYLVAAIALAALFLGGCASNDCYTETGYTNPYGAQGSDGIPSDELDPFADDPFEDDPFADDPFEDDPFADDPFEDDPVEQDSDEFSFDIFNESTDPHCPIPPESREILDPIEPINRLVFWMNDKLYTLVLKPVARGYRFAIPEPARMGIGNFFSNLATPIRAANSLVQLKIEDALTEVSRFVLNSTFGILGFIDIAGKSGLKSPKEDFGQTLGHYGVGNGFYLVLPFFGPSSARDAVGRVGDLMADPLVWAADIDPWGQLGMSATKTVNAISLDKDTYEALVRQSLDPYATMRSGYVQMRRAKVAR